MPEDSASDKRQSGEHDTNFVNHSLENNGLKEEDDEVEYDDVMVPEGGPYEMIPDYPGDDTTISYIDMRGARNIYENDDDVTPVEAD